MTRFLAVVLIATTLVLGSGASPAAAEDYRELDVYGWVERVDIHPQGLSVKAKLDSGARTSSLDARNIRVVRQSGNRYVRFDFIDPDSEEVHQMKLPRVRGVRIVRHSGNHQRRHVVELDICLGDHRQSIEVSLIDRSNFNYPLLLGRSALEDIALIDSGATFTRRPSCPIEDEPVDEDGEEVPEDADSLDYDDEQSEESESGNNGDDRA